MLNIVLFGPPGAGKGTQSENLIRKYKLTHISTGDLFRKHLSQKSDLGKMAQQYMDKGNLVPDEVVISMVEEEIKNHLEGNGFIFDGFPRTVAQAKSLDEMLAHHDLSVTLMVALEVPEDELRKRIKERAKTSGRVDDQDDDKITNRIQVYQKETTPVAKYYKEQSKFHGVPGVGTIEGIFEKICAVVDSKI